MVIRKVSPADLMIIKLEDHDFSCFDCGDEDLNDFIRSDAKFQMDMLINVTYVCIYDDKPVGYVTLSNDTIKINDDKKMLGSIYPDWPAVKIGRLAVQNEYKCRDIGSLIMWVIGKAQILCKEVGIRFTSVDLYRDSQDFYKKNFFTKLEKGENMHIPMYTDIDYWK